METRLDLDILPDFDSSAFRRFEAHEHHVTRRFGLDVLIVVFDGVLRFRENGVPIEVAAGSYYIQQKNILYDGKYESDKPEYYYIHFSGEYRETGIYGESGGSGRLSGLPLSGLPLSGWADLTVLMPLFRKLEKFKLTSRSKTEIYAVFYSILQALANNAGTPLSRKPIDKLVTYMIDNLADNITLDMLSAKIGYCKNHIIKLFADEVNMTPHAYLTHLRLEAAVNLMNGTDMTFERIGIDCGFGSYINFYKAFNKAYGCPPGQFKQKS